MDKEYIKSIFNSYYRSMIKITVRVYSLLILFIFCLSVMFFVNAYSEDSPQPWIEKRVSLDFKDIEIIDALKFLSTKAGINIIPTNQVAGRVNLSVEDAPLGDIFDIMVRSNDLAYDKKGEIYNIMTEEEYKQLYGKNFYDLREVKVFELKYVIPEQAYVLCDNLRSEIGKVLLNEESGAVMVMDTPRKIKEIGKALASLESKNTEIKIFDLKYANSKDIANQLKNQLDLKNVGSIKSDERTNQVIVQTLPERMSDIKTLIEGLDLKTKQVLVEVRIVKIEMSDALTKGIEWEGLFNAGSKHGLMYIGSYPFSLVQDDNEDWISRKDVLQNVGYVGSYPFSGTSSDYSAGKQSTGSEEMHIGIVGKHDVDGIIRYLRTLGNTRLVANPKIAVINNQEARIHIGEKQAYLTQTTTQTASTNTVAEEVTFVDVGIQLFITPTINADGFVTLRLKPEISSVISFITTPQDNKIPIINSSVAETTVIAKDGSTIVIGGLKEEKETTSTEETPFFSRIPLLGNLLRKTDKENKQAELLIMVTPHIISGDEITTGYNRDFGYQLDKEGQDYSPFTSEQVISGTLKPARPYLEFNREEEKISMFKPARSF